MTVSAERGREGQRAGAGRTERPRLVLPGLIPADPRLERYRVHPGAVTAVELDAGDELKVIDPEGRQRGELTVLADGGEDFASLGTSPDTAATVAMVAKEYLTLIEPNWGPHMVRAPATSSRSTSSPASSATCR